MSSIIRIIHQILLGW